MRPVDRIPEVLQALGDLWMGHPGRVDMRLGQLLVNYGFGGTDPWFIEDDVLLRRLRAAAEDAQTFRGGTP